ncbi:MAG: hypothetical protein ACHQQ3_07965 [Gemmatimonadales bacterium]
MLKMQGQPALRTRDVLRFWLPLGATWLMMSAEGPYVAAIVARMHDAALNLAAYGVAFALAWLGESPIMMLLTTSNRLVHDRASLVAVRRFMRTLITALTLLMLVVVAPPVYHVLTARALELPAGVATLLYPAMLILVPWPAAIGYRRFYQGILVRHKHPRRVAYGTIIRLSAMSVTGATLALLTSLHGATVGASALVAGVLAEAVAARWMARYVVATLLAAPVAPDFLVPAAGNATPALSQRDIARFYYPLALTSVISMVTGPLLTFFMGRGRSPIESLAVLPVVQNLVFLFRGGGVAYQEVAVALSGPAGEHEREVERAAFLLATGASLALAMLVLTPLAGAWFGGVAGLSPALATFAGVPAALLVLMPATEYWTAVQRSRFILNGRTRVVTGSMAVEVSALAFILWLCIARLDVVGAIAASLALQGGKLASNGVLLLVSRPRGVAVPLEIGSMDSTQPQQ